MSSYHISFLRKNKATNNATVFGMCTQVYDLRPSVYVYDLRHLVKRSLEPGTSSGDFESFMVAIMHYLTFTDYMRHRWPLLCSDLRTIQTELLYCSNPQRNVTVAVLYTNYSYKNDIVYHSLLFACSVCFSLLVSFYICVSFVCVLLIS